MSLIDRILSAENNGIQGATVAGSQASVLVDGLKSVFLGSAFNLMVSLDGTIPVNRSVPQVLRAGSYFGYESSPNSQEGFNGDWQRMMGWRKRDGQCTTLCSQFSTPEEQAKCRADSTDYFREINSECVGVSGDFIGHQVRSFPVQYYGFYPTGWDARASGGWEKTPPQILSGDGFQGGAFTDTRYLRFGGHLAVTNPTCEGHDGTTHPCPEMTAISIEKSFFSPTRLPAKVNGRDFQFRVRLRYRNQASNGNFRIVLVARDDQYRDLPATVINVPVTYAQPNWSTIDQSVLVNATDIPSGGSSLSGVTLRVEGSLSDTLLGWVDLDAIELIELGASEALIPTAIGSFASADVDNLTNGDYAANIIDRLGGIAWWGSGSHHLTSGVAFSSSQEFVKRFYAGRSLGESVLASGSPASGQIYGDPLYSPAAVSIHLADGSTTQTADLQTAVFINSIHGRGKSATTRWKIERWVTDHWVTLREGVGGHYRAQQGTVGDIVDRNSTHEAVQLRLSVWNPGEENHALSSALAFEYIAVR